MTKSHPVRGGLDNSIFEGISPVVGTLDSGLRIERISDEARILFDLPLDVLLGEAFLTLVAWEDVPTCLTAYADAAASQRGVTVNLKLRAITTELSSEILPCEVLIVPLRPAPGFAFVLRPVPTTAMARSRFEATGGIPNGPSRGPDATPRAPGVLRRVADCDVPGVARLTTRELQIVSRLLDGHRPPGIARALFLSQSTVRNHLASVFRKLGVTSQEALLELFRDAPAAGRAEPTPLFDDDRVSRIS